jgi:hypothetical protein
MGRCVDDQPLRRLILLIALVSLSLGTATEARAQDPVPALAVPCEDPAAALAPAAFKTCECAEVDECPYDTNHSCLEDRILCRRDACGELLDDHPIDARCSGVTSDQTDLPNIVFVVSDDLAWPFYGDVHNRATGERYSLWNEYYRNLVCHGGDEPGRACVKHASCGRKSSCQMWTHRCEGGADSGHPCKENSDCSAPAACTRCLPGECSSNPMHTPNLVALAESGVFFPVAHTTASKCTPSITGMLTGTYGKNYRPRSRSISIDTVPRLLNESHCSVSIGKTWFRRYDESAKCYDCCCEQSGCCDDVARCPSSCSPEKCCGDPSTGFHYSIEREYHIAFQRMGRHKNTLEKGACLLREMNQSGKAFFTWLLPYAPHVPGGAPLALQKCYSGEQRRVRVDGRRDRLPTKGYMGRVSWFDCILGSFLDFLETTPDSRFCPHPDGHTPEAHDCGPCMRACDAGNPCGEGVACVEGKCASDVPCLIDTTIILYMNDNGKGISRSKARFTENGYRSPMILSRGGLGLFNSTQVSALSPAAPGSPIAPLIRSQSLAHANDLLPTVLHYATCPANQCSEFCPPPFLDCGNCLHGDCFDNRCVRHRGRSLRPLLENGSAAPWRKHLFGHKSISNRKIFGENAQYLRSSRMVATGVPGTTGSGSCNSDLDCATQGWSNPNPDLYLGLDRCVNGICTRECLSRSDCTVLDSSRSVECINGFCATASACKLYHFPGECGQKLYNVANDPDERRDLLESKENRALADPLDTCYDENPTSRGRDLYDELACELVRWCLEDCSSNEQIACSDCCALDHCGDCKRESCNGCLAAETCVAVGDGDCADCRRACEEDRDCDDLGLLRLPGKPRPGPDMTCAKGEGKCNPFCRRGAPIPMQENNPL